MQVLSGLFHGIIFHDVCVCVCVYRTYVCVTLYTYIYIYVHLYIYKTCLSIRPLMDTGGFISWLLIMLHKAAANMGTMLFDTGISCPLNLCPGVRFGEVLVLIFEETLLFSTLAAPVGIPAQCTGSPRPFVLAHTDFVPFWGRPFRWGKGGTSWRG